MRGRKESLPGSIMELTHLLAIALGLITLLGFGAFGLTLVREGERYNCE